MASVHKQKTCGCKGIRTCLLCEKDSSDAAKAVDSQSPSSRATSTSSSSVSVASHTHSGTGRDRPDRVDVTDVVKKRFIYCPDCKRAWERFEAEATHPHHEGESIDFPGILLVKSFVTAEEEVKLVEIIDQTPWVKSQSGRCKQDFGPKVNFKKKKLNISVFSGLPAFCEDVVRRWGHFGILDDFRPVELCNLEYEPERGSAIDPHFDDFWLWGERLVTINLLSMTYLTMSNEKLADIEVSVEMPAGSLIVVFGPARYKWKHAIRRQDIRSRRVAMTFRELTGEFLEGGEREALGKELLDLSKTFNGLAVGLS